MTKNPIKSIVAGSFKSYHCFAEFIGLRPPSYQRDDPPPYQEDEAVDFRSLDEEKRPLNPRTPPSFNVCASSSSSSSSAAASAACGAIKSVPLDVVGGPKTVDEYETEADEGLTIQNRTARCSALENESLLSSRPRGRPRRTGDDVAREIIVPEAGQFGDGIGRNLHREAKPDRENVGEVRTQATTSSTRLRSATVRPGSDDCAFDFGKPDVAIATENYRPDVRRAAADDVRRCRPDWTTSGAERCDVSVECSFWPSVDAGRPVEMRTQFDALQSSEKSTISPSEPNRATPIGGGAYEIGGGSGDGGCIGSGGSGGGPVRKEESIIEISAYLITANRTVTSV